MGFLFWGRKKEEEVEHITREEHEKLRNVVEKTTEWIKHLHARDGTHEVGLERVEARLSKVEGEIEEMKDLISFFGPHIIQQRPKKQTAVYKQTAVGGVQTAVQTAVYMPFKDSFLTNLSLTERAIVWILINTDMKLSYEDISAVLGKSSATVRGQINSIKQKQEGLVEEVIEKTGKKRFFVPEQVKSSLIRTINAVKKKVRKTG